MLTRSSVVWVAVVVGLVTGASSVGCSSGSSPGAGAGDGGVEPTGDAAHKADAPAQIDAGVDAPHLMGGYTVVTIATAQSFPGSVAVDDKNVYWAADGIMQVGKGGGTPITLTSDGDLSASSSHAPWDALAADGADVYYVSNGIMVTNLVKVPVGGGAITTLATGAFVTNAIALDSANVYVCNPGIIRVPKAGGAPTTLVAAPVACVGMTGFAVNATTVGWIGGDGSVVTAPIGGGTPTTLNSLGDAPAGLAMDATSLYWGTNEGIVKTPVNATSGASGAILCDTQTVWSVAVTPTNVYWTTGFGAVAVPLGGGTAATITTNKGGIYDGIATDGTSVYWSQEGGCSGACTGTIVKATPK